MRVSKPCGSFAALPIAATPNMCRVIKELVEAQHSRQARHIPYRDSRLTFLLQVSTAKSPPPSDSILLHYPKQRISPQTHSSQHRQRACTDPQGRVVF